jgi:hypothetical protein
MKYVVVQSNHLPELTAEVNARIKLGYEPLGGVQVAWSQGSFQTWAQAMVLKSPYV